MLVWEAPPGRLVPLLSLLTLLVACGQATSVAFDPGGTAGSPPAEQNVPSDVQPSVDPCSEGDACRDCDSCLAQCLCTGESFDACQAVCGDTPSPASCSEADACAGCTTCVDTCACSGGTEPACTEACSPVGPDAGAPDPTPCTAATGCTDCNGCTAQCVCAGDGDLTSCQALCEPPPPPPPDGCTEDPLGLESSCDACTTCLASCTCAGTSLEDCMDTCGEHDCCSSPPDYCLGVVVQCTCSSPAAQCFGSDCSAFSACDSCACTSCPGEIGVCQETYGCLEVFNCMRVTRCRGSECIDRCWHSELQQAYPAQAFSVAEALRACEKGSECSSCAPPAPTSCPTPQGDVQCPSHQVGDTAFSACCTAPPGAPAGPGLTPDSNPCGLDFSIFTAARSCEPREQANLPRSALLETCPDASVPGIVHSHALLKGCCRAADRLCGFYDDITGLGCVSANVFGLDTQPCQ